MAARKKFWTYENKLTTMFFFVIGIVFFDRLIINYLMPFIQEDLNLNNADIGLLAAAVSLTWALGSIVGGRLSDKVKSKRIYLVVLIVAFSVASFFQGFVGTFMMLLSLRLLMGAFEGPIVPVTQSVLAMESSERRRGFNLGFTMNTANGLFGSILAPLVIVAIATAFDWRTAFFFTVLPGLVIALFVFKIMREPKLVSEEETAGEAKPKPKGQLLEVLKNRNIILSIVMFSGFMVYLISFQVFGPVYLVGMKGFSPTTMSYIMAAFGLGTAVWGFVVPLISDRIGRKPAAIGFGFLSVLAPLSVLVIDNPVVMAPTIFLLAAGMGAGGLAMSVIPAESVSPLMAGLAVGLPVGIGEIIGGFLNPMITGALADQFGLPIALIVSSGGALVATLIALFLKETAPSRVKAAANKAVVANG
ncbi:MFS transporter [Enteractinococcus helveticum]|uniref:MFS transporter n=1 Tax=Enteractinococcus helveticum TaxID=1837282 RepID=A0A1B7M144_9MICC|nr:MFS transporter [Enteractinococcus helveticum]OAV62152.1 MFS transporter [Enteractinococcus helveticum]